MQFTPTHPRVAYALLHPSASCICPSTLNHLLWLLYTIFYNKWCCTAATRLERKTRYDNSSRINVSLLNLHNCFDYSRFLFWHRWVDPCKEWDNSNKKFLRYKFKSTSFFFDLINDATYSTLFFKWSSNLDILHCI